MTTRTQFVMASLLGSLCLYCAPQAVDSMLDGGPVPEVDADAEPQALVLGQAGVPAGELALRRDRACRRVSSSRNRR